MPATPQPKKYRSPGGNAGFSGKYMYFKPHAIREPQGANGPVKIIKPANKQVEEAKS